MAYDKRGQIVWWRDADGQPCWFANGIPSLDGHCVWCGTPSKEHLPPQEQSAGDRGIPE